MLSCTGDLTERLAKVDPSSREKTGQPSGEVTGPSTGEKTDLVNGEKTDPVNGEKSSGSSGGKSGSSSDGMTNTFTGEMTDQPNGSKTGECNGEKTDQLNRDRTGKTGPSTKENDLPRKTCEPKQRGHKSGKMGTQASTVNNKQGKKTQSIPANGCKSPIEQEEAKSDSVCLKKSLEP